MVNILHALLSTLWKRGEQPTTPSLSKTPSQAPTSLSSPMPSSLSPLESKVERAFSDILRSNISHWPEPDALEFQEEWNEFTQETASRLEPADSLSYIMQQHEFKPATAIDLGCGTGSDTLYLLKRGWRVIAIDNNALALNLLAKKVKEHCPEFQNNLTIVNSSMENYPFNEKVQFINATQSLPFCHPAKFRQVWERLVQALDQEGVFCGQFYGHPLFPDSPVPTMYLTMQQVETLMEHDFHKIIFAKEQDPFNGSITISTAGWRRLPS